jgi:hypothetical protein
MLSGPSPELLAWDPSTQRAWRFFASLRWISKYDNGHAISIGFVIGQDIEQAQLDRFIRAGSAREVDYIAEVKTSRPW